MRAKPVTSSVIAQATANDFSDSTPKPIEGVLPRRPNTSRKRWKARKSYEPKRKSKSRKPTPAEKRAAYRKADMDALSVEGIYECLGLFRDWFNPQTGISTKSTSRSDCSWYWLGKCFLSPSRLLRHISQKEWIAITWGKYSNVRVIDADCHTKHGVKPTDADWNNALWRLWDVIRQIHMSRSAIYLPPLKNGQIPDGVHIDGVITKTPRGYHYIEALERQCGKRVDDAKIMREFVRVYRIDVGPGKLEIFPSSNGQSRLPLGKDCQFFYPPHQPSTLLESVQILQRLPRVVRRFPDMELLKSMGNKLVDTYDEGEGIGSVGGVSWDDMTEDERIASELLTTEQHEQDQLASCPEQDYVLVPRPRVVNPHRELHIAIRRDLRKMKPEVRGYIGHCSMRPRTTTKEQHASNLRDVGNTTSGNKWVMDTLDKWRNGASAGERNKTTWDLLVLLRCTFSLPKETVHNEMERWIHDVAHGSADLNTRIGVRAERRRVAKLLDKIDRYIATGRLWFGNQNPYMAGDGTKPALLKHSTSIEEAARWEWAGKLFLGSAIANMPQWIQNALPALVGAILEQQRGGRLVMSARTLQTFANTPQSKVDPFTGEVMSAYRVLLSLLHHFDVVTYIVEHDNKGKRLARVFAINIGVNEVVSNVENIGEVRANVSGTSATLDDQGSETPAVSVGNTEGETTESDRGVVQGGDDAWFTITCSSGQTIQQIHAQTVRLWDMGDEPIPIGTQ